MPGVNEHALNVLRRKGIAAAKVLYVEAEGQSDVVWYESNAGHRMHVELMAVKNATGYGYSVKAQKPKLGLPI